MAAPVPEIMDSPSYTVFINVKTVGKYVSNMA
jgi:hypothetical protein